jgi:hypothetical protein
VENPFVYVGVELWKTGFLGDNHSFALACELHQVGLGAALVEPRCALKWCRNRCGNTSMPHSRPGRAMRGLVELRFDDLDELINLVEEWAAVGEGENPARRVIVSLPNQTRPG